MTKFLRDLILGLMLLSPFPVMAARGDFEHCVQALSAVRPSRWAQRINFERHVQLGDRTAMSRLIDDGIISPGSIQYLRTGVSDPRLRGVGAKTTLLVSNSGDVVRVTQSAEVGQGRALVNHHDRVYEVELSIERITGGYPDPLRVDFQIPLASRYQQGLEWVTLSEETRMRLNLEMGYLEVASTNYREGGRRESVPLRVVMPTGKVFTQVDEPAFWSLERSLRDEQTGLIWSQAKEKMIWIEAKRFCRDLGGYLPSLSQFRGWVRKMGGSDGQPNLLISDSLWSDFWSSSVNYNSRQPYVVSRCGHYGHSRSNWTAWVWCVRSR